MPRKYEELWSELKTRKYVQRKIPRKNHEQVIKALRRESAEDTAFRFICVENECYYTIGFSQIDDNLYLRLEFFPGINPGFVITPERIRKRQNQSGKYEARHLSEDEYERLKGLKS